MKISRELNVALNFIVNDCLPPIIRDARWFMPLLLKLVAGERARLFREARDKAFFMSDEEFAKLNEDVAPALIARETDLNQLCIDRIQKDILGETVLDAGCGRGFLVRILSAKHKVSGCDVWVDPALVAALPEVIFSSASTEKLPFPDGSFDTVVCTHTLEHVIDLQQSLQELRRVAQRRLIIVVPRERPYRCGYNLHLHFFPYAYSVRYAFGRVAQKASCENIGGDWYYTEDIAP